MLSLSTETLAPNPATQPLSNPSLSVVALWTFLPASWIDLWNLFTVTL